MKGNTLIEILVYISLLTILTLGVFSSVEIIIKQHEMQNLRNEKDNALLLENYHE